MQNYNDQQAIAEAMRRYSGQVPSGAGFSGGMAQANSMMPATHLRTDQGQMQPKMGMQGTQPNLSSQMGAIENARPDQTTLVLKSLIRYLDRSTAQPSGGM